MSNLPPTSLKFIDIANAYNASGLPDVGTTDLKLSLFAGAVLTDGTTVPLSGPFNTSMFYGKTFQLPNPEFSSPSFTSTINLANTAVVGYTLDKDIASGTIKYETGSGWTHTVDLSGSELDQGTFSGELTNPPVLTVGTTYNLTFNGTDFDGNAATPVTLTGTIPFGQFGTNYRIKQYGGPCAAMNTATKNLWNQMRAAYNDGRTVKLHVVNGTPYLESTSGTLVPLSTHIADSAATPGATMTGPGTQGTSSTFNVIPFSAYFNQSAYSYNQLHNATFLIFVT